MGIVLPVALGVGGASVIGAFLGFWFRKADHRFHDVMLSFAAGVMLAAAAFGLILPSLESGGRFALPVTLAGIFCGALCVNLMDRAVPHLHKIAGVDFETHPNGQEKLNKVLLFVIAIAIHNLPEVQRGTLLQNQTINGNMLNTCSNKLFQRLTKALQRLTRQCVN